MSAVSVEELATAISRGGTDGGKCWDRLWIERLTQRGGGEREGEREQRTCEEFWKHNASVGWVLYAFGVYGLLWIKPLYALGVCDLINSRLQGGRLTFVVPNS